MHGTVEDYVCSFLFTCMYKLCVPFTQLFITLLVHKH